jgi:hypothetical protein
MALPADLRARFSNNPEELINFLDNPENKDEAIRLGLLDQKLIENEVKIEAEIASLGD